MIDRKSFYTKSVICFFKMLKRIFTKDQVFPSSFFFFQTTLSMCFLSCRRVMSCLLLMCKFNGPGGDIILVGQYFPVYINKNAYLSEKP